MRTIARIKKDGKPLIALLSASDFPLGLRREALRSLARLRDGGRQILELGKCRQASGRPEERRDDVGSHRFQPAGSRPGRKDSTAAQDGRGTELAIDRRVDSPARRIRRRGRDVFFKTGTNSCAGCHRVQGRGQWVGPDLSTIGVKYGRDELIRSILSPSDSIGYSYRSVVAALNDGRVITGLVLDDTADKLVIKTADGQRISVEPTLD